MVYPTLCPQSPGISSRPCTQDKQYRLWINEWMTEWMNELMIKANLLLIFLPFLDASFLLYSTIKLVNQILVKRRIGPFDKSANSISMTYRTVSVIRYSKEGFWSVSLMQWFRNVSLPFPMILGLCVYTSHKLLENKTCYSKHTWTRLSLNLFKTSCICSWCSAAYYLQ